MASANAVDAVYQFIKVTAAVTNLLVSGASSIYAPGNMPPDGRGTPCITIASMGDRGDPWHIEHFYTTIRVRAYFGQEKFSLVNIGNIINQLKLALDGANLGTISGIGFFDCQWAGYTSGDMYDPQANSWYQEIRFRVYQAQKTESGI